MLTLVGLHYGFVFVYGAGDKELKIWDVLSGGRLVHSMSHHQKTITCLSLDSTATRLLTGSLDQHVKFIDCVSYQVTHSMHFAAPVLSMGISVRRNVLFFLLSPSILLRLSALDCPDENITGPCFRSFIYYLMTMHFIRS